MKLTLITIDSVSNMSNDELNNHHLKVHQLWSQKNRKNMNIDSIKKAHEAIKSVMVSRGLKHNPNVMKQVLSKLSIYNEDLD